MKRLLIIILLSSSGVQVLAQTPFSNNQVDYRLKIFKTAEPVKIDGRLDEAMWKQIAPAKDFINQWPIDSGRAKVQTEVRLMYDDQYIYVGVTNFDTSNQHIIQTLKRDSPDEYFGSDGIAIVIDPINTKSSGFFFGVNAGGAQIEAQLQIRGGQTILDDNWDNRWYSEISRDGNTWYVEMAIPFKTLRYNPENRVWGLNFVRNDMKNNFYSSWAPVPVNLNTIDLGYNGAMDWEDQLPKVKKGNVNVIPYIATGINKDYESNENPVGTFEAGLDAKVAITPSLNLDLTINPDFSNVEVDRQVTNLTRFSLFFPEKRDFFLENSDLFGSFGLGSINPFFSRRIGLNNGALIPIKYGARLSGNLNQDLRVGLISIQTSSQNDLAAQNYSAAAFQQRIGQRSLIKGLFVNRQRTDQEGNLGTEFNRVVAIEASLLSPNGKLGLDFGVHKSFNTEDFSDEGHFKFAIRYNDKRISTRFSVNKVGQNYLTDVGFVPRLFNYDAINDQIVRLGFYQMGFSFAHNTFPKAGKINLHGPRINSNVRLNDDGSLNEVWAGLFYFVSFKDQSSFEVRFSKNEINLPFTTFIIGSVPLPNGKYNNNEFGLLYRTNPRKAISGRVAFLSSGFYGGDRIGVEGDLNYRIQPWANFGLAYNFNSIDMPTEFDDVTLHLIGPKAEISFSNKMFWTTFLQYNTQIKNFNLNSRFQWRFRPMSDLFIVYTDNYTTSDFSIKNRGMVLKINYWL